jgi:hypothetical protein
MSYQRLRDDGGHYELEEMPIYVKSSDTDTGPATTAMTSSEPKSTASVGSPWTIGWKTPMLICLFYVSDPASRNIRVILMLVVRG